MDLPVALADAVKPAASEQEAIKELVIQPEQNGWIQHQLADRSISIFFGH